MAGTTDTVPAMLTPGEFVIKQESAAMLGEPLLQKLNAVSDNAPQGYQAGNGVSQNIGAHGNIDALIGQAQLANMKPMYGGGEKALEKGGFDELLRWHARRGKDEIDPLLEALRVLDYRQQALLPDQRQTPEADILKSLVGYENGGKIQELMEGLQQEQQYTMGAPDYGTNIFGQKITEPYEFSPEDFSPIGGVLKRLSRIKSGLAPKVSGKVPRIKGKARKAIDEMYEKAEDEFAGVYQRGEDSLSELYRRMKDYGVFQQGGMVGYQAGGGVSPEQYAGLIGKMIGKFGGEVPEGMYTPEGGLTRAGYAKMIGASPESVDIDTMSFINPANYSFKVSGKGAESGADVGGTTTASVLPLKALLDKTMRQNIKDPFERMDWQMRLGDVKPAGYQAGGPVQGAPAQPQPQPQPQNNLQIDERQANPQMYQGSTLGTVQEQVMMLQDSIEADTVNKARKTLELLKLKGLLENAEPIEYKNPPRSDPRMIPTPDESSQIRNMMIGNFSI